MDIQESMPEAADIRRPPWAKMNFVNLRQLANVIQKSGMSVEGPQADQV
jgi:hypothetical protein